MNDQERIIRYWHAIELLQPQTLKKPRSSGTRKPSDEFIHDILSSDPRLPWLPDSEVSKQALPEPTETKDKRITWCWGHTLHVHLFRASIVTNALQRAFGADQGYREDPPERTTSLYAAEFSDEGFLVPDSLVLSSEAWFLGRLLDHQDWDSHFNDHQRCVREQAEARLTGPVSRESLNEFTKFVLEFCGLCSDLPDPEHGALRAISTPVKHVESLKTTTDETPSNSPPSGFGELPLNSFLLDDLDKVARNVAAGQASRALSQYLSRHDALERKVVDCDAQAISIVNHLLPAQYSAGCWPSPHDLGLVHSQQLAVNLILNTLQDAEGIMGINGPPGTGKTTLLRDMVAAIVTKRADVLAQLERASDAFEMDGMETANCGGHERRVYRMKPMLFGHEIVVASSNNGAVENITKELPQRSRIDPRWLPDADYFGELGTRTSGEVSWALISAALGSKSRRSQFISRYFYGPPSTGANDDASSPQAVRFPQGLSGWLWEQAAHYGNLAGASSLRKRNWQRAVQTYREAREAESRIRNQVSELQASLDAILPVHEKISTIKAALQILENTLNPPIGVSEVSVQEGMLIAEGRARSREAEHVAHQNQKPGLLKNLMSFGAAGRNWSDEDNALRSSLLKAQEALSGWKRLQLHQDQLTEASQKVSELAIDLKADHIQSWLTTGRVVSGHSIELQEPWKLPGWRQARARVFIEALHLHQTFLEIEARRIWSNLDMANRLIKGDRVSGLSRDCIRSSWASLFMVVPVLSSTFASFDRSFGSLECSEIGWLLVDEAGQASPQAAVGALWRARRAVFVGDPLQLKPVMSVSDAALEHMRTHFQIDNHWLPNRQSAQTLADLATPWGRMVGKSAHRIWAGLPLVVHRRCDKPMFMLANRIAYDGAMVYGTLPPAPEAETPARLPTGWVHTQGSSEGNWVPAEGEKLRTLMVLLHEDGVPPADIAVITPFRDVLIKIRPIVKEYPGNTPERKPVCGTIHTMQGKEAAVVIMVLGGNTASPGARDWAVSEPNLLNVATTRARRRFYVIGDRNDWQHRALFSEVMDLLPPLDVQLPTSAQPELSATDHLTT